MPVRVATLNLLNNPHSRWPDREPLVIEHAKALDADAYAFQEVNMRSEQVDRLVEGLGLPYTAVVLANPDPESIKSLAIITRLEVEGEERCTTLEQGDLALLVKLRTADGDELNLATTHFHFSLTRRGSECRERQANQLLHWLGARASAVVVGDFNSRDGGAAIAAMKRRFRSAHEVANGREPELTHPTPLVHAVDAQKAFGVQAFPEGAGAAIDYVFVDPTVEVDGCRVAWHEPHPDEPNLYPSDHFGLVADLRLR